MVANTLNLTISFNSLKTILTTINTIGLLILTNYTTTI